MRRTNSRLAPGARSPLSRRASQVVRTRSIGPPLAQERTSSRLVRPRMLPRRVTSGPASDCDVGLTITPWTTTSLPARAIVGVMESIRIVNAVTGGVAEAVVGRDAAGVAPVAGPLGARPTITADTRPTAGASARRGRRATITRPRRGAARPPGRCGAHWERSGGDGRARAGARRRRPPPGPGRSRW